MGPRREPRTVTLEDRQQRLVREIKGKGFKNSQQCKIVHKLSKEPGKVLLGVRRQ